MKKLIAFLLAAAMMVCFAACTPTTTEQTPSGSDPVQDSFTFTYNGVKIALNAPAEPIVEALGGNPKYTESPAAPLTVWTRATATAASIWKPIP